MNNAIRSYLATVSASFPSIGVPERTYLRRLEGNLEDYFSETPPASPEEISRRFGTPEDVIERYYASASPEDLRRQGRGIARWNWAARVAQVGTALFAVLFCCLLCAEWQFYQEATDDYYLVVIIEDVKYLVFSPDVLECDEISGGENAVFPELPEHFVKPEAILTTGFQVSDAVYIQRQIEGGTFNQC